MTIKTKEGSAVAMKDSLSNLEVYGAIALYKEAQAAAYYKYTGEEADSSELDGLFFCGGLLNSEACANGYPYYVDDRPVSYCLVTAGGRLVAVTECEDEQEAYYEVDHNGFHKLGWINQD